jgi:tetratricopeptide (TPR) repeat protein
MEKSLCGSDGRVTGADQQHNWASGIAMATGTGEVVARAGESHMAESIFDAITGGEPEEAASTSPASGAHPFAAALAADMTRHDPEVAAETAIFLRHQSALLRAQESALDDERKGFEAEWTPRLIGTWLKIGFQVFTALIVTVLGVGALLMLSDALDSHSVIVEPFDAPPSMAASGLSGQVVAGRLLDELTRLQAATHSDAAKRSLANDWKGDIKVDLPDTGISIGEIGRLLHQRFGHDLHIGGDLVQSNSGDLTLTVRGDGVLPKAFTGSDLGKLTTEAAEYVYGESQPGLFVKYLSDLNRNEETIAFAKSHLAQASLADKPYLLNYWGNAILNQGGPHANEESLPLYREAVRIQPDYWAGYNNIMDNLLVLGDEEGDIRVGREMIKAAGGRPGKAPEFDYNNYDLEVYDLQADRAGNLANIATTGGTQTNASGSQILIVAQFDAQLHDVGTARLRLTTAVWDPKSHSDASGAANTNALLDEELGDLPAAAKAWDDFAAAYADPVVSTNLPQAMCWAAPIYQRTGQPEKADAALAAPMKAIGISTFVDCYRFRGDVLDLRGDWKGAQIWYAKAVKLGPDIPSGYYSWGVALMRHGDLAGAAAKFAAANVVGPHWADPLEKWGEILMLQNHSDLAAAKFAEADKYAANWGRLHLKWGEALFYAGQHDAAKKQFALAGSLYLSAADKAALAHMQALDG